jgi:hypothetical protein
MEIASLFENYIEKKKAVAPTFKSERAEIISKFVDELNSERTGKYKPLSPAFVSMKMSRAGLKTNSDLYWFLGYCKDARNFSKCWWYALDAKNTIERHVIQ